MKGHEFDRAIDALARRQHGAFHRRQAVGLGCTPRMIDHRRAIGAWLTLAPSVYALASHPFTWLRQAKAAELSIPGAVVSHRAAAVLHGFEGFRPGRIDLTAPRSAPHTSTLAIIHRREPITTTTRQLIEVTSVARTVVDLSGVIDPWTLARTIDEVLLTTKASTDELNGEVERAARGHQRHIDVVRGLVDDRADGYVPPSSELEAGLYAALDSPLLPAYMRQATLPWWPSARQRVDALMPEWRLIVEADGRRWHARVADFGRDQARDHLAQRHGYDVVHLTHHQLSGTPRYAIALLLDIGAHRRLVAA